MGKSKRSKSIPSPAVEPVCRDWLAMIQIALLCIVAIVSPIFAAQMMAVPALAVQSMVLAAAVIWQMRGMRNCSLGVPGGMVSPLILTFAVLLVVSIFGSISIHATIRELLNVFSYILVFLMVADMKGNRREPLLVLACLMISGLVVGAVGIREYLMSFRTAGPNWRIFSTFFNPDYLAGFLALVLPVMLGWFLSSTSSSVSGISGLAGLFTLGALLLTGSRFGAVAGFIGIVACLIFAGVSGSMKKPQKKRLLILLVPGLIAVAAMAGPLIHKLSASHGVKAEMYSLQFRLFAWKGTAHMAMANPINGTGLGTFELGFPKYAEVGFTRLAHNSYLQIAGEAGPLSAVVLIVLLCAIVFAAIKVLVKRRFSELEQKDVAAFRWEPEIGLLLSGLLGGIIASMFRNLVDSDWYVTAVGIGFWLMLGVIVAIADQSPRRVLRFTPGRYAVANSVTALVLVGSLFMLTASAYVADGDTLVSQNEVSGAADSYKQAASLDVLDPQPHFQLAQGYFAAAQGMSDQDYAARAERELERVIKLSPTSGKAYYRLAKVLVFEGNNEGAIRLIRKGLTCDPHSPSLLNLLAETLEANGKHDEAISVYGEMAKVEDSPYEQVRAVPEIVEPLYIFARAELGRDMEKKGDTLGAIAQYERASDRVKKYQDSVQSFHQMLELQNRRDTAMDERISIVTADLTKRLDALKSGNTSH